jgi:hypothetical protein
MTDRDHYDLLTQVLRDMISRQDWNSRDYRSVWRQIRNLKNKFGGFPPTAEQPTKPTQ